MSTSIPLKEKKKVPSSKKHNRMNTMEIVKRNRKVELKKADLIPLLSRFEGELQAKDIALAALKSEKIQLILSILQMDRFNQRTDPHIALFRNSEHVKDGLLNIRDARKTLYETHLTEVIIQQKKQIETLKSAFELMQNRCLTLNQELENEKKEKLRLQTYQKQLLLSEQEKIQLKNDLQCAKVHNEEIEQQLIEITKLLEYEHEKHKKFVLLLLNERHAENNHHKQQLTANRLNTNNQHDIKLRELESKHEEEKKVLLERIAQLQNENDLLIKEKRQQSILTNSHLINEKSNESISTTCSLSSTINSSSGKTFPSETMTTTDTHCPTIVPTLSISKNENTVITKTRIHSPSLPTRTQQVLSLTNSTSAITPTSQRRGMFIRPASNTSLSSSTPENVFQTQTNSRLVKSAHQTVRPTGANASTARINQTSFSSEYRPNNVQTLLETLQTVTKNRVQVPTVTTEISMPRNNTDLRTTFPLSSSDDLIFQAVDIGNTDQLRDLLQHDCNPNSQMIDGNTCLHLSVSRGHIQCIRYLLQFGANPSIENNLGRTAWNNLSLLNETTELECLQEFTNHIQNSAPIDLLFNAIEHSRLNIYNYLLPIFHERLKTDFSSLVRLIRTALRSSNTDFLQYLLPLITIQDLIQILDSNTFISNECLTFLSSFEDDEDRTKPMKSTICISSTNDEHPFSYAIGSLLITNNMSWLELERSCSKIFLDHIAQLESPFGYEKSPLGYSTNNIDTLTLGETKWYYQDSPNDNSSMPYTIGREHSTINIHLKGIDTNSMDSLAYNYFLPSQTLKTFLRYIEQNAYVGVYGPAYLQKKSLFEDLIKYLERPNVFSVNSKFQIIRFEFEIITSLDDCIDRLVEQDFLRFTEWKSNHSTKFLLYFSNIQNSGGYEMINLLLNSEMISNLCNKFSYTREDNPNSTMIYYFPSMFHLCVTLSKRSGSTEIGIYKKFKWIPFKIDSSPWNGMLKRHLWRRMIDINIRQNRTVDQDFVNTLQWITNVWQRYNECLQKFSLQDAALGPALFFDCPMEREAIFEWLQTKWNTILAPLVREYSMNKSTHLKTKDSKVIASSVRENYFKDNTQYEAMACQTLYILLQRAVSRDCALIGEEKEQYLLSFIGSRVEDNGNSSLTTSSATSSRAGSPQSSNNSDVLSTHWNDEKPNLN